MHVDHVVLVDERHLEVELGELRLAVGARVLVAEAAGDLVVALEAADHQQLLEQLRRLGQRVERARLRSARGHEVVARALGRRAGQVRRLDLEEVALVQDLAHRRDDAVAQGDAPPASRARRRSSARWRRRRASSTEAPSSSGNGGVSASARISSSLDRQLDLAGGEVGVDVLRARAGRRCRRR